VVVEKSKVVAVEMEYIKHSGESVARRYYSAEQIIPRTHLLSNGNYAVMITSAGAGYSRFRDINVTRWREDVTRDYYGNYIFLREIGTDRQLLNIFCCAKRIIHCC
ncbi:MAG: hypothetical protein HQK53_18225, partial [Oligoflexia bacterium]|nr:hypothetical protein [Oligoflexia bacterium]